VHLSLCGVSKRYDHTDDNAVSSVSLDVLKGEFVSLLGPSGSGKTTILMMLAGFLEPSDGDIKVGGSSVLGVPPHRRNIGVVFQNYALFPKMTVAQNIGFALEVRGIGATVRARRVEDLLRLIRLDGYGQRYPHQLSGGQQQRVALARALSFDPSLLLLDEPMGALDRKLRDELQLEVKRIQQELAVTTLYVTHDQTEAMALSDRVAIMNGGRLQQVGNSEDVYLSPANAFVASFLGEANLLKAVVVKTAGEYCELSLSAGGTMLAKADSPCCAGKQVQMFVRPEAIVLGDVQGRGLQGVLEQRVFQGETTRLRIRLRDGSLVVASLAGQPGGVRLEPNVAVVVGWHPEHARVLPSEY
jgi:spermidine/putrescine ABC transporter ATP-binding subunit